MIKAREIMTTDVVTVKLEMTIEELTDLFLKHKVNGFPVVDDAGHLLGVVTEKDMLERSKNLHVPTIITLFDAVIPLQSESHFAKDLRKLCATKVADLYSEKAFTITPDHTIKQISEIMTDRDIHTLPVVENGKLAGIIGKLDVIRALRNH